MTALIDAHCHFDFPAFDGRRNEVLAQARAQGVVRLVIPGVRAADWERVQQCAELDPATFYCLGIHPWFVAEHVWTDVERLRELLVAPGSRGLAVGECGLDRLHGELAEQMPWFEAQVDLARELDLPLVIHSVRTHDEVCAVLRRKCYRGRALVHGFSGSIQQARKLVALGCLIGVGGIITHARAAKTRATVAGLPLSVLVLETDAPDMAPEGVPAGQNSPACLVRVYEALCSLRPEPPEVVAQALWDNTCRLYGWASEVVTGAGKVDRS